MKRNSTTLFLESPGATTPLPWINNAPDFSAFSEPTLSVLINSWNEFLLSGQELEVIPDPDPPIPEPPQPDWQQFGYAFLQNPDNIQIFALLQGVPEFLYVYPYFLIFANGFNPDLLPAFATTWNGYAAPAVTWTPEIVGQINVLLEQYYIPFYIDENGMIILS